MLHYIKLELRKSHMKHYIQASMIASIVLLVFIYFVAFVAQVEQEIGFQQYPNIYLLTSIVWMIFFSIVTALMYCRVMVTVLKEHEPHSSSLKASLLSRMVWMLCFSTIAMLCSIIPSFVVFSVTETFFPLVQDALTADVMFTVIKTYLVFTCCINGIGMIAMRVGLMKKSTSMTILTAIVLCAVLGNLLIAFYGNDQMNFILSGVMIAAVLIVILELWGSIIRLQER
ncbi:MULTISPECIES: bacitracin ABC transporter permease [unclassified Bacillus (in: firmicutes)]|uniref:bacitracin ABC transporter permease n=1 Tax=unclassified Bacillus (in: firmicutes) TaxID=185979 RepID=UPI000D03281B|nr:MULTISPECIES: bacitracin ABC transporter permease [unclassified Bacillus (in: firmicutes)]PRS35521.1 bacitracin ABC transporter permease [Bacillus sp. NMCC4]PRS79898.1 bacitracin ABC transporter permease [Bacillus sp. CJCL2]PRS84878.1 bacitracin ABC transporter permease [Bacillus sp. YBWC18]